MPPRRKTAKPATAKEATSPPPAPTLSPTFPSLSSSSFTTSSSTDPNIYAQFQAQLEQGLDDLIRSLTKRRSEEVKKGKEVKAVPKEEMDGMVEAVCDRLPDVVRAAPDSPAHKSRLEFRRTIVSSSLPPLVTSIAYPSSSTPTSEERVQAQVLHDALDVVLIFVEREWAKEDTALVAIEEVLETASVEEAERTFSYLESRVQRLTKGMVPEKGNSLVFLRMQNNLLRRLSKSLHTVFCGRILAFLASVFPISERSGVNLRGTFNVGNVTIFEGEQDDGNSSPEAEGVKEGMDVESKELVGEAAKREAKEEGEDDSEAEKAKEDAMQVDASPSMKKEGSAEAAEAAEANKKREEEEKAVAKAKAEAEAAAKALADKRQFYQTFWSLQPLLSNPLSLFQGFRLPPAGPVAALSSSSSRPTTKPPSSSSSGATTTKKDKTEEEADPSTPGLATLREGIVKTLEVFAKTNRREVELSGKDKEAPSAGAGAGAGEKGKAGEGERGLEDLEDEERVKEHYFFPKYLTKRNLLDLEIADPYFRRQILTQFLIVLGYIRSFSQEEKNVRAAQARPNKALEPAYVYGPRDEVWVKPLLGMVWKTIDAMVPDGSLFARTVQQIIKRDSNWVLWKANSCQSFEKPPLTLEEQEKSKAGFKSVTARPPANRAKVGTDALTRLWEGKVSGETMRGMDALKGAPSYDELLAMIQKEDDAIEMRKLDLQMESLDEAAIKKDPQIIASEDRKTSLLWRAKRVLQTMPKRLVEPAKLDSSSKDASTKTPATEPKDEEMTQVDTSADVAIADASVPAAADEEEEEEYEPQADEDDEEEAVEAEAEATKEEEEGKDEDDVVNLVGEGRLDAADAATALEPTPAVTPKAEAEVMDVDAPPAPVPTGTPKRAREEDAEEAEAAGSAVKKVKL